MRIREVDEADRGYVVASWRESHKQSPKCARVPWDYYKATYGTLITSLLAQPDTRVLGAYADDLLLGYLVMTPGKRVNTVHWAHTKHTIGTTRVRRKGVLTALLEAAELGKRLVYTMQGPKIRGASEFKTTDAALVEWLRTRGVTAVYTPLKEWSR